MNYIYLENSIQALYFEHLIILRILGVLWNIHDILETLVIFLNNKDVKKSFYFDIVRLGNLKKRKFWDLTNFDQMWRVFAKVDIYGETWLYLT